jgi:Ca2+-binding RTX toxin-like protein
MRSGLARVAGAAAALALALPAAAGAATLNDAGGVLSYTAAPGATNVVGFHETLPGTIVVTRDALRDGDPVAASGCTASGLIVFVCTGVTHVVADAGDGDDTLDAFNLGGLSTATATLSGGAGDDVVLGGARADVLDGGPGDDVVAGGPGDDALSGGAGDDQLSGDAGADSVSGGDGDDTLELGSGADVLSGGAGIDAVHAGAAAPAALAISLDGSVGGSGGATIMADVEDVGVDAGTATSTVVTGNSAANVITIASGNATVTGGAGNDILTTGPGNDTIDARDGYADRVKCGAGTDVALVDAFDTVSDDCESVQFTPLAQANSDLPPAVAFAAPAAHAALGANAATLLQATASDDHGVALVRFLDGDRLLCEDAAAPFSCAYQPQGGDVGRDTLLAIAYDLAGQSATAIAPVSVGRFRAPLSLALTPARDRSAPYAFKAHGRLALPATVTRGQGCSGKVTVTAKAGKHTLATRHVKLSSHCGFSVTVRFHSRPATKLKFSARFAGNDVIVARASARRNARTR